MSARAAGDVRREQRGAAARQRQRRPRHGEGGGGGGGSGAGPAATAAAMAAVGERRSLPSPEAMLGQPWSHWVDAAKLHGNDGEWPPSTAATLPPPPPAPPRRSPRVPRDARRGRRARRGARVRSHPRHWRPRSLCGARPPGRLGSGAERAAPAPVPVIRDTVRGGRSRSPEPGTSCPGFRLGVGRAAPAAGEASPALTAGPRSPRSLCSRVCCRVPTGERGSVLPSRFPVH